MKALILAAAWASLVAPSGASDAGGWSYIAAASEVPAIGTLEVARPLDETAVRLVAGRPPSPGPASPAAPVLSVPVPGPEPAAPRASEIRDPRDGRVPCQVQSSLVLGPAGEVGPQRFLRLCLLAPADRMLAFPTADATLTDDSIGDQSGRSTQGQPAPFWNTLLTPAQFSLWNTASSNKRTNASRLHVERIVEAKYSLTLANNSQTDTAWVDIGPVVNAIVAAPNSGTVESASLPGFGTGILAGRQIVVRRGPSAASAYEVQRFYLYSDVNLTVQ
jgi:hypothetical protein